MPTSAGIPVSHPINKKEDLADNQKLISQKVMEKLQNSNRFRHQKWKN